MRHPARLFTPVMKRKPRQEDIRTRILREWRGFDEAANLEQGIQKPADFMAAILKQAGMSDGLDEDEVRKVWSDLAGDFIAQHTEPVSVKDGILQLRVTQPAMRFHLEQMKPMLLKRIQAKFDKSRIKAVHFKHG